MSYTQEFSAVNLDDDNGNPAGGVVAGTGLSIRWQDGPLGKGDDRQEPNGVFVETVLSAALQRLNYYQSGKFQCWQNHDAILHISRAIACLRDRTQRRAARGVEGTHTP